VVVTRVSPTTSDKFIYQTDRNQVGHRAVTSFAYTHEPTLHNFLFWNLFRLRAIENLRLQIQTRPGYRCLKALREYVQFA